jgi:hypothetical protein
MERRLAEYTVMETFHLMEERMEQKVERTLQVLLGPKP